MSRRRLDQAAPRWWSRHLIAVSAMLLAVTAVAVTRPEPASAAVYNPIPANQFEEITYDFT
jgi:hypothetical protein